MTEFLDQAPPADGQRCHRSLQCGNVDCQQQQAQRHGQPEPRHRNPVEPGKVLLDFDPRGQQIDVLEGQTVIMETLFPDS